MRLEYYPGQSSYHNEKKYSFSRALLALKGALQAEKPLAGMGGLSSNTPRAAGLAVMAEERLQAMITSTESFSLVNPELLKSELIKFQCLEETCMLRLAGDSGISLFIRGDVDERADVIVLTLEAFGTDFPFNGRRFHRYRASIKWTAPCLPAGWDSSWRNTPPGSSAERSAASRYRWNSP
jgi:hypothetical protein